MRKLSLFFIAVICLALQSLHGQNLLESRQTSYFTYVYQLADKEAIAIYKKGLQEVEESFFHTLVLTYPTDSIFKDELPSGHYLFTWAEGENLNFELISISNVNIKVINNGADLNIMLHDLLGNEIKDARVKVGRKKVPFKEETQSYFLKGANKKGMLEIDYQGVKTFTYLERELNNPKFRRFSRKVLYSVPIKYLWIPVSVVLQSPYDLYKTVRAGRPSGIFYYVAKPFKDIVQSVSWGEPQGFVEKLFCPFDNYYCEDPQYEGYLIFNKPKYMPGDTVKFKAFITNKRGKPIKKKVNISLYSRYNRKNKKDFEDLTPYRKGGYEFQFPLHDSLRLQLDSRYTIELIGNNYNSYISGDFEYEDYELKSNQYELRADKKIHHKGEDLNLYASGTDNNGLNLFDAQFELFVLSKGVDEIFAEQVILPDTMWHYQQKLESVGETKIVLPDSIFPAVNFDYEVSATFTNAENEQQHKGLSLRYSHHTEDFLVKALNDSILFNYNVNGEAQTRKVKITSYNEASEEMEELKVVLPYSLKLNPFVFKYKIEDEHIVKHWQLTNASSQLEVLSDRSADSLFINVDNPRKLVFRYFIYEQDKEIAKGSGTELNFKHRNRIKGKYFISLHYVWAGEVISENYEIPFREKQLSIKVFEPGTVFPGQESEIKIMVQDAGGAAVENADLSAFAFTKKFERTNIPAVPYFGKKHKARTLINSFEDKGNEISESTESLVLDWQMWNAKMHLDSIEYFRFLYPRHNYSTTVPVSDTITQFAPYLVKKGKIQPVHIIYLDNRPVYFSIASHQPRYAFRASPGYHQLRLRTNEHEIKVDSIYIAAGVKNIFSFLMDEVNQDIQISEKPKGLTVHENNLIKSHLISIESDYRTIRPSYLIQGENIYWINQDNHRRNTIVGPLFSGLSSYIRAGSDTIDFDLEQRYHYSFQKNLIKMKYDEHIYYHGVLNSIHPVQQLHDTVLTEKQIKEIYIARTASKQASWKGFINPAITTIGKGRIKVLVKKEMLQRNYVKNFILLKDNAPQFLRVYSGATSEVFHDLTPGSYTLYALLDDNAYFKSSNIDVVRNATTHVRFQKDSRLLPDETSDFINKKIKEIQETNNYSILGRKEDFKEIRKAISTDERVNRYYGATIFGVVTDAEDGTRLPGVNVIIKGSSIGTITNMDGEYSIVVPDNYGELVFSFIGYMTEEVSIGAIREMNVTLAADVTQLQEVVVVGYGMQEKRSLTSSVTSIEPGWNWPRGLQGRVAGVSASGAPGASATIQIRGVNTVDATSAPLYVIDGIPYSGSDFDVSPDMIESIEVLKEMEATAIYGSRAKNGVVLITLKAGTEVLKTVMANNTFMEAMEASSSIRNNFSDYAYWEPKLRTDKNGLASFKVKFPDDITAWKTHVFGMTDKRQSGQYEGEIKALKTVAGTLATPAFLVEGDRTALIGKALNYTSDSLDIAVAFEVDGVQRYAANAKILHSNIDTLRITAPKADTVDFQYSITKKDGYFDGELRSIPVYKRGIQETLGDFYALEKDTVFTYRLPFGDQPFKISATSNVLEVLMEEADNIRRYEYLCNEQVASKIKALLVLKKIKKFQNEKFNYDLLLKRLINNLQKNQKNQLWGWWPESVGSYWISLHVLEALLDAEKDGYKLSLDRQPIIDLLAYNFETRSQSDQIRILKILNLLEAPFDYKTHLDSLQTKKLNLANHFQVQLLRQALKLPYTLDSLLKYQKETMFGGIYWEEPNTKVYSNTVLTTVNAYQLIKKSGKNHAMLSKIRAYFLESRRNSGYWRNTYEASKILETILPDLLEDDQKYEKPKIAINGTMVNEDFPFEIVNDPAQEVTISRSGTGPVFLSVSQEFWNENPEKVEEEFILTSKFDEGNTSFVAGKETTFKINLNLKKEAEYIMLEIPVPAGFSYVSKTKQPFEDHREHYKNKVNIYFTRLAAGSYDFDIRLLPRFSGIYHLNPAKASLMYFPVFYGRNEGKKVEVR